MSSMIFKCHYLKFHQRSQIMEDTVKCFFLFDKLIFKQCTLVISGWITQLDLDLNDALCTCNFPKASTHHVKPPRLQHLWSDF